MNSCLSEIRRCRPVLGTLVEISAAAHSCEAAQSAVTAAFDAIAKVEQRMSFYQPSSDVSRINTAPVGQPLEVSPMSYRVLAAAAQFHRASAGVFDITIAPELQRWGCLPKSGGWKRRFGNQAHLELLSGHRVLLHQPLRIDLGGIAKGFAVDEAIETLKDHGINAGTVNAGGDLRTFGSTTQPVHVRHPGKPGIFLPIMNLREGALATSASYFSRRRWRGRWVTPLVNGRTRRSCLARESVSVYAPDCLTADALTKIVMAAPADCAALLAVYGADARIVTHDGKILAPTPPDAP